MTVLRVLVYAVAFCTLDGQLLLAAEPQAKAADQAPISYYKKIRPIFQMHCQGCHQPARPKGGYIMTSHAALLQMGESQKPGVIAGKPEQSLVVEQITSQ